MDISYKVIADLIIVVSDMNLSYSSNSIDDLLKFLGSHKEKTIWLCDKGATNEKRI